MIRKSFITAIVLMLSFSGVQTAKAGGLLDSLEVKARLGYNIGGTSPIGMPRTIRSIDAYHLTPSVMVGVDVALPLHKRWGVTTGLHFENKGMKAKVTTKSYHMEMKKGDSQLEGLFTGHIKQDVAEWMLTLPIQATYKASDKVTLRGGPYFSLIMGHDFSGIAYDGYLRQGDPTGPKIEIGDVEGEWATYDFSDKMRRMHYGIGIGADWEIVNHIGVSADLNWGLNGVFHNSFKTIEQTLYPIYANIGVFYKF